MIYSSLALLVGLLVGLLAPGMDTVGSALEAVAKLDNCATECNNSSCCCHASLRKSCNGNNYVDGEPIPFSPSTNVSWTGCAPNNTPNNNKTWPGVGTIKLHIIKEDDGCCTKGAPYNCGAEDCEMKFQFEFIGQQPNPDTTDCAPQVAAATTTGGSAALDTSTGLFALITLTPGCGNCPDFEFYLTDANGQQLTDTKVIYADCDPCPIGPGH